MVILSVALTIMSTLYEIGTDDLNDSLADRTWYAKLLLEFSIIPFFNLVGRNPIKIMVSFLL